MRGWCGRPESRRGVQWRRRLVRRGAPESGRGARRRTGGGRGAGGRGRGAAGGGRGAGRADGAGGWCGFPLEFGNHA
jgi:hypothetical protein